MITLCRGRYRSRTATTRADVSSAQALRHLAFHGVAGFDSDEFDPLCQHILIEEVETGRLACCFRLMPLRNGSEIGRSYAAQSYDLSALAKRTGPMAEIGRFCIRPGLSDPDILRVAWGALTTHVDATGIELLFGCTSFAGTDAQVYSDTFALLKARHLAPRRWLPGIRAPDVVRFGQCPGRATDARMAMLRMPPLLRTYLMMGGWVSDHAVVDTRMNTLHVFTGVEISAIPAARKRLLRGVSG